MSQKQNPPAKPLEGRIIFAIFLSGYSMSVMGPERKTQQKGQFVRNVVGSLLASAIFALLLWMTGCGRADHREMNLFTNGIQKYTLIASSTGTVSEWDSDILKTS